MCKQSSYLRTYRLSNWTMPFGVSISLKGGRGVVEMSVLLPLGLGPRRVGGGENH